MSTTAMMANLSVRVPRAEKELFLTALKRNGTDAASAIRTFIHSFIEDDGYPFDTTLYYPYDETEEAEIAKLKNKLGKGEAKSYRSAKQLREGILNG
ncbi:MAG: hypothetical protein LBL67_05780 [Coriobacteriales bacterium]|jgi:antitoxin component of RelBE/YafQ-DinJ toxin-antitoxin module|nr:hypothetical protein [Coriobacteriales bacterium]